MATTKQTTMQNYQYKQDNVTLLMLRTSWSDWNAGKIPISSFVYDITKMIQNRMKCENQFTI